MLRLSEEESYIGGNVIILGIYFSRMAKAAISLVCIRHSYRVQSDILLSVRLHGHVRFHAGRKGEKKNSADWAA